MPYMEEDYGYGYYDEDEIISYDADGKYKTELCKNWIETAKCRYEEKCRFAYGQEELTIAAMNNYNEKFKSKNCRTFYHTKQCLYGNRCMFRHEHRNYKQLHRHFYTPQIFVYETLWKSAKSQTGFIANYKPATTTLSVFKQIHAAWDAENAPETPEVSDSELSEIEHCQDAVKTASVEDKSFNEQNSGSFLNTTSESVEDQIPHKFALNCFGSPARIALEVSDEESCGEAEEEDIDVSLASLGLDFV
jgi:hypothetical protein